MSALTPSDYALGDALHAATLARQAQSDERFKSYRSARALYRAAADAANSAARHWERAGFGARALKMRAEATVYTRGAVRCGIKLVASMPRHWRSD